MRISTSLIHEFSLRAMQAGQEAIYKSQNQIASGKRFLTPSEAPADAMRVLERTQSLDRIQQFQRNIGFAQGELNQQDALFGDAVDTLRAVRDLALQMNNATYNNENRASAALVVRQRIEYLMSLANSRDTTGNYLFSGFKGETQPFAVNGSGAVQYYGDQGARMLRVGEGLEMQVAEDGGSLFMQIPSGNGTFVTRAATGNTGTGTVDGGSVVDSSLWVPDNYTVTFAVAAGVTTYSITDGALPANTVATGTYQSGTAIQFRGIQFTVQGAPADGDTFTIDPSAGKSIFATLKELADALATPTYTPNQGAALNNAISSALTGIDQAMDRFVGARARAGERLNSLDAIQAGYEARVVLHQQNISSLVDTDYAEAVSNLSRQMQALEASQKAYAVTKDLTLFNYI